MTHKFASQEETAQKLIERYGTQMTLRKPGPVNTATSPPTVAADIEFTVTALQSKFDQMDMAAGNTKAGDLKLLIATGDVEPENGDKIEWRGSDFSVVSVMSVAPAGVPVLWKVVGRNGA